MDVSRSSSKLRREIDTARAACLVARGNVALGTLVHKILHVQVISLLLDGYERLLRQLLIHGGSLSCSGGVMSLRNLGLMEERERA